MPLSNQPTEKTSLSRFFSGEWKELKSYFNLTPELEPQIETETSIRAGVSFKGSQLLVLIFAIFIASLGLNTNSIPVIIGAMLISPLMGPIIGIGLAIGIQDFTLLKKSLKNISMAVLGSLLASALYFLISPQYEGSSQLLARTSPSIYDVFVAIFGGAAGFVSIVCKNKGQVMPGVAIATSLMPPLCTAGYGIATWQASFFFGALYLFFTNMIFILFATWIGVKLLDYKSVTYQSSNRARKVRSIMYSIITATIIFSCYLTYEMIKKNLFLSEATDFVEREMIFPNTQVLSHKEYISKGNRYIDVTLIGQALPKDSLQVALMAKLDSIGLGGTILKITQGFSITENENTPDYDKYFYLLQNQLVQSQRQIDSLQNLLNRRDNLYDKTKDIAPEIKILFPQITDIATANMSATTIANMRTDTVDIVVIHASTNINNNEYKKLEEYIKLRLGLRTVHLSINPPKFPWPKK